MQLEYAKNPVWANAEQTVIDLTIKWDAIDEELPFSASLNDPEAHGRAIYEAATAGQYGVVAEYATPADITGEEALAMVRTERGHLLATEVDPVVSNPLRWGDLSEEQQQAWATYRRALLDITTTYPNPSYVWDESQKHHVLINCTFPTKL